MPLHRKSAWWLPFRSLPFLGPGQLLERALPRRLVLAPSNQRRAVAKSVAGHMVVADLDNELGPKRLPVSRAFGAPAARTARCIAGEAGRLDQTLEKPGELGPLGTRNGRGEADMVELALLVVETKQQRADLPARLLVAEAADDAICRPDVLDLQHGAFARAIGALEPLGDDAVEIAAGGEEPLPRLAGIGRDRRQAEDAAAGAEIKPLEGAAPLRQGPFEQALAGLAHQAVEQDDPRRVLGGKLPDAAGGRVKPH